jgi:multiple sugar transport system permease protein
MGIRHKALHESLWVGFFLFPSLAGLLVFLITPMLSSLVLTFYEWDPLLPTHFNFLGLQNYLTLVKDTNFWDALLHTLFFIAGYIPLVLVTGLSVALLMNQKLVGRTYFRGAFFMPVISAWVAVALMWTWIFNPKYGIVNYLLGLLHIAGPAWLYDPNWAMPAIILTSVWKDTGFIMVLFLSGLQAIPQDYYEAASLDGAGGWSKLRFITLPLLSPTVFFTLIISLINSFQVFDQVWIMTQGGPAGSTSVLVEQIINNSFRYGRMGYAATLSWVLFLIIFLVTVFQTRMQKNWVTYE